MATHHEPSSAINWEPCVQMSQLMGALTFKLLLPYIGYLMKHWFPQLVKNISQNKTHWLVPIPITLLRLSLRTMTNSLIHKSSYFGDGTAG